MTNEEDFSENSKKYLGENPSLVQCEAQQKSVIHSYDSAKKKAFVDSIRHGKFFGLSLDSQLDVFKSEFAKFDRKQLEKKEEIVYPLIQKLNC